MILITKMAAFSDICATRPQFLRMTYIISYNDMTGVQLHSHMTNTSAATFSHADHRVGVRCSAVYLIYVVSLNSQDLGSIDTFIILVRRQVSKCRGHTVSRCLGWGLSRGLSCFYIWYFCYFIVRSLLLIQLDLWICAPACKTMLGFISGKRSSSPGHLPRRLQSGDSWG